MCTIVIEEMDGFFVMRNPEKGNPYGKPKRVVGYVNMPPPDAPKKFEHLHQCFATFGYRWSVFS